MSSYSDTDPHAVILLTSDETDPQCLHVWRDEAPVSTLEPGDLVPLPGAAIEAAGENIESAGVVDRVFFGGELPDDVSAMLPDPLAPGCECVIILRVLTPEVTEDGFVFMGAFDPADAKPLLRLLEEHEVPFEVEADHSELLQPGRGVLLYLGMIPAGSCLRVFVHKDSLGHARKLLHWLYPPEKAPHLPHRSSDGGDSSGPPARPAMEVYTPPSASIPWEQRRDFYIRTSENIKSDAPDADG